SERGDFAVNGAFLLVLFVQRGHILADRQMVNVVDFHFAAKAFVVWRRDVIVKLNQVAFVIAQRVIGGVALVFQVLDEIINVFLHPRSSKIRGVISQVPRRLPTLRSADGIRRL